MRRELTESDLMESARLIRRAVELEQEARRLRERAAMLAHPSENKVVGVSLRFTTGNTFARWGDA